jgi:hypothetical protein
MSLSGLQLRGTELPAPGAWVSVAFVAPPLDVAAVGCVRWRDERRCAIGVSLERGSNSHHRNLAGVMLALAFEAETPQRAALVLADDLATAAELCEPLRQRAFVPVIATTPLDVAYRLSRERPRIEIAVIAGHPFGITRHELHEMLDEERPGLPRIEISDPGKLEEHLGGLAE